MQGWVDLCYVKADRPGLNPRPVNRKSNALPLSHHKVAAIAARNGEIEYTDPTSPQQQATCYPRVGAENAGLDNAGSENAGPDKDGLENNGRDINEAIWGNYF